MARLNKMLNEEETDMGQIIQQGKAAPRRLEGKFSKMSSLATCFSKCDFSSSNFAIVTSL